MEPQKSDHQQEAESQPVEDMGVKKIEVKEAEKKIKKEKKPRKCYLHTALMPVIFWIIFSAIFTFFLLI